MNQKFSARSVLRALWTGALMISAVAASADTQVTFQVDMTVAMQNSIFDPTNQTVAVSGTFDSWASLGFQLTNNPNAANPNLYTGTLDDTTDTNGAVMDYQYRIMQATTVVAYSAQADSDNYCAFLPTTSGASLVLPVQFWSDDGAPVTNNITFQVDMAEQIQLGHFDTNTETVYAQGSFQGWSDTFQLTNDPAILHTNSQGVVSSNVYVGTYSLAASPGAAEEFKFVIDNGGNNSYEGPTKGDPDNNNNRFFVNETQTLPIDYFSDLPLTVTVTNTVTFEVDMTTQIEAGNFTVGSNTVEIHGDYNAWGSGTTLTNDPNSSTPNIYSLPITYIDGAGAEHYFKYVIQPGTQWENVSAANAVGGNRYLFLLTQNGNFTNGPVYFSDEAPSALIDFVTVSNCMVTFTVQMTNAVGTDGTVFDNAYPSSDTIYLNGLNNGDNNSFWTWAQAPFPGGPSAYAMTQISNTTLFTITLPVAMGQNDELTYKYSINGFDNEAGFGDNHSRWIRSLPDYTMPTDTFGGQGNSTQSEIPAGNLGIAPAGTNQVQVSWLGRRGVELQTASDLAGPWTSQTLTDGTNLIVAPGGMANTNFSIGAGDLFYRLVGPQ